MKWTLENDEKLRNLVSQGKKHSEISNELGISMKSVSNRCFRIGLTIVFYKKYQCLNCSVEFSDFIKSDRKFCSQRCCAIFSSTGKCHTEETKNKIKEKLTGRKVSIEITKKISGSNNPNWIDGRSVGKRTQIINGKRKCRYCKEFNVDRKHKSICADCRLSYYEFYKPGCNFKFNISDFVEEFDFSLVEKHGWYKPTNRGNNLMGISRDHLYSVRDGFINKIDPKIISHPANCELMLHIQNSKKNSNSSITFEELLDRIKKWELRYGPYSDL